MKLAEFNSLATQEALDVVRSCAHVDRWAREVVDARPFASVSQLVAVAESSADPWTEEEIDHALARHPRIGERAQGEHADAQMSRREQASLGITDDVQQRLDTANAAYERTFGFVFLIRAAGRSSEEILQNLQQRMTNSAEEERHIAADQLRQIAALRLEGMFS